MKYILLVSYCIGLAIPVVVASILYVFGDKREMQNFLHHCEFNLLELKRAEKSQ